MSTIHLVIGYVEYQGEQAHRAFLDRTKAEALLTELTAWKAREPKPPAQDAGLLPWSSYQIEAKAWRTTCPLGEAAEHDDEFRIEQVELVP